MAVHIRLARYGRKKKPFYRVVVANSEAPRDGKFIEIVGTYDPLKDPSEVNLKQDKIQAWLDKGAKLTDTVRTLMAKVETPVVAE